MGDCNGFESEAQQSKGCELWEQPKCRDDGQKFEERSGKFVYHTENGVLPIQSTTISNYGDSPSDCREYCWNHCDCVGYRSNSEGVCEWWTGTYLQFEEDTTGNAVEPVYVLNHQANKGKSRIKKWIWQILIPTAISLLLLGLLLLWWRRRKQDPNPIGYLSWKMRLNIIEGTAQSLLYLHKYSRVRIIHRDMKVSNILLDENMNPKISDFGIAKILKQNTTEANTIRLVGTFGYMAPEYVLHGVFSMKSDVYSFGVLVLEIVSGKKNNSFRSEDGPLNLVEHAWELWNKDAVLQLVDPSLISNLCGNEEQLCRCINVGLLCVEDSAVDRPSMADVVSMFTNENLALPKPKKPAFVSRFSVGDTSQDGPSRKFTVNELSISTMDGKIVLQFGELPSVDSKRGIPY